MKIQSAIAAAVVTICMLACSLPWIHKNENTAAQNGVSLLVAADGEIQLKRRSWHSFIQTALGAAIYPGDQLQPAPGSKAVVLCQSLTEWIVPAGAPVGIANGCPASEPVVLKRGVSLVGHTRGGTDPWIPYVITPRQTLVLTKKPLITWNPVPGAISYTVRLVGEKVIWEISGITTNQVFYAGPALQEGKTYRVIVDSDTGVSSQDEAASGLGFTLLDASNAKAVQTAVKKINRLQMSEEAKAISIAQLYQGYGLLSEASLFLEEQSAQGTQLPAVFRLLGDIYYQAGLTLLARDQHAKALELFTQTNDLEGQAEAQLGLAQAYLTLGNYDEARSSLTAAHEIFTELGDSDRLQFIVDLTKTLP